MFIAAWCGGAAWRAEVTIVRRVQPPSQPPPAGGRRRVPAPSGGRSGKGRSPCPRRHDAGGTPALPGHGHWAWCAMRMTVSREHRLLEQGCGETRFPYAPARGKVWEAKALEQGSGETGFPHAPTRWEGLGGRRPPRKDVHPVGVRRSRMDGCGDHRAQGSAPPPGLLPLGGGAGFPPPAGAGQGRGGHRARGDAMRAGRPRSQGMVIGRWAPCA